MINQNRLMSLVFVILVFLSCKNTTDSNKMNIKIPSYELLEDKVYDIPLKSQISYRVVITDTTITKPKVVSLIECLVREQSSHPMSYHKTPTHVFVYVYSSRSDYESNSGSWVAMYSKIGTDSPGEYQYNDERLK